MYGVIIGGGLLAYLLYSQYNSGKTPYSSGFKLKYPYDNFAKSGIITIDGGLQRSVIPTADYGLLGLPRFDIYQGSNKVRIPMYINDPSAMPYVFREI